MKNLLMELICGCHNMVYLLSGMAEKDLLDYDVRKALQSLNYEIYNAIALLRNKKETNKQEEAL